MKPILILPVGEITPEDIQRLNDNGICTVEAKNPSAVQFVDPIPAAMDRTNIEEAAIRCCRRLLRGDLIIPNKGDIARLYLECLIKGTPLDPLPLKSEVEQQIFDEAKRVELCRLAREEAKAERAAAKAAKSKASKPEHKS